MYLKFVNITALKEEEKEALKKKFVSKYGHVAIVPIMRRSGVFFSSYLFIH